MECEDSTILTAGLKNLQFWSENKWRIAYALTDNSAVEPRAVKDVFSLLREVNGHLHGHLF